MATRRDVNIGIVSTVAAATVATKAFAQQPIILPPPTLEGGKSLLQALKDRKSTRDLCGSRRVGSGPFESAVGRLGRQSVPGRWPHSAALARCLSAGYLRHPA